MSKQLDYLRYRRKWIQLTKYVRDKEELRFATDQLDKDPSIEYKFRNKIKNDKHDKGKLIEVWAIWRTILFREQKIS